MILVTGSTGFIGRSVINALTQRGALVKPYTGRMNDPLGLRAELLDVETVIHLAGSESRGSMRQLQHVDVEGTERLLEESRRMYVKHLIVISRLGANHHSVYPLLRAKGQIERLVQRSGIPYTIVRSATLFGRDDRFLNTITHLARWSWPFVWLPAGGQVAMQPLWVEDLARCLVAVITRADLLNQVVEVAGEERLRYEEIVRRILAVTGMRRIPLPIPMLFTRRLAGLVYGWRRRPAVHRFFLDRFTIPDIAPVDSVLRRFGFNPVRLSQNMAHLRGRPGWIR
jgi:uncharacterized protein YbjT (DUF2867 family)